MKTNVSEKQASAPQTKLINYRTYNLDKSAKLDGKATKVMPIDRRSIFGNPFKISKHSTRKDVVNAYEKWFYERVTHSADFENKVLALQGHTLGCWCRPAEGFKGRVLCHGQIIIAHLENCWPEDVE